jgi:hypothetical protein
MRRKMEIGEYVVVRDIRELLDGAKAPQGKRYLLQRLSQEIDLSGGLLMLTIVKDSARKYHIDEIITEDDSVVLDAGEITLTADWYNIKRFNAIAEITYYNDFLGETSEPRLA